MTTFDVHGKPLSVGSPVRLYPTGGEGTVTEIPEPDHRCEHEYCGPIFVAIDGAGSEFFPAFSDQGDARCFDLEVAA